MLNKMRFQIVITTGLALFAMFFGAGNIIFPLKIGAIAGEHINFAFLGFVITGVGVPFLGVFAVSLYEGNYWDFFNRLTKPVAFVLVSFLIITIGLLIAAPRTSLITYNSLLPILPQACKNPTYFSMAYFGLIFFLILKQSRVVDIIGLFFSPLKIISFLTLIVVGIYSAHGFVPSELTKVDVFKTSLTTGYATMDLLAAFFFCSVAYKNIANKCKDLSANPSLIFKMMLIACLIGGALIGAVYIGFIYIAAGHAEVLANISTPSLIVEISNQLLGAYGAIFVGLCVFVACLATATTLAEVTTDYFYNKVFRNMVPRTLCLAGVLIFMFVMSIMGFDKIMLIAGPILDFLYPFLIILCIVNIIAKLATRGVSLKIATNPAE